MATLERDLGTVDAAEVSAFVARAQRRRNVLLWSAGRSQFTVFGLGSGGGAAGLPFESATGG